MPHHRVWVILDHSELWHWITHPRRQNSPSPRTRDSRKRNGLVFKMLIDTILRAVLRIKVLCKLETQTLSAHLSKTGLSTSIWRKCCKYHLQSGTTLRVLSARTPRQFFRLIALRKSTPSELVVRTCNLSILTTSIQRAKNRFSRPDQFISCQRHSEKMDKWRLCTGEITPRLSGPNSREVSLFQVLVIIVTPITSRMNLVSKRWIILGSRNRRKWIAPEEAKL